MLKILSKRNIIDYIPHKKTPLIAYTRPRVESKYINIPRLVNEERKERFEKRILAMSHYAEQTDICRSQLLLSYFGEKDAKTCGVCDICRSKNTPAMTNDRFREIATAIKNTLKDGEQNIDFIVNTLSRYPQKEIVNVIRHMADQKEVIIDKGRVRL